MQKTRRRYIFPPLCGCSTTFLSRSVSFFSISAHQNLALLAYTSKKMDSISYRNLSFEESCMEDTHHFPENLPKRVGPPPAATPSWKRFWAFSLSSYSLIHTEDRAVRMRRIAMVAILLLRGAISGLNILSAVIQGSTWRIVVYSLLTVLSMWFTATCLAIIGDAVGDRKVRKLVVVGCTHFLYL